MKYLCYCGMQLERDAVRRVITGIAQGFRPKHRSQPSQEERELATVMDCLDTHVLAMRWELRDLRVEVDCMHSQLSWQVIIWHIAEALRDAIEGRPTS